MSTIDSCDRCELFGHPREQCQASPAHAHGEAFAQCPHPRRRQGQSSSTALVVRNPAQPPPPDRAPERYSLADLQRIMNPSSAASPQGPFNAENIGHLFPAGTPALIVEQAVNQLNTSFAQRAAQQAQATLAQLTGQPALINVSGPPSITHASALVPPGFAGTVIPPAAIPQPAGPGITGPTWTPVHGAVIVTLAVNNRTNAHAVPFEVDLNRALLAQVATAAGVGSNRIRLRNFTIRCSASPRTGNLLWSTTIGIVRQNTAGAFAPASQVALCNAAERSVTFTPADQEQVACLTFDPPVDYDAAPPIRRLVQAVSCSGGVTTAEIPVAIIRVEVGIDVM